MPPPTPSTAPARSVVGGSAAGAGLKSDPKPILFFDCFFIPLWIDFGSLLALVLEAFWRPDRPKFGLKCPFKPYLFQKRESS